MIGRNGHQQIAVVVQQERLGLGITGAIGPERRGQIDELARRAAVVEHDLVMIVRAVRVEIADQQIAVEQPHDGRRFEKRAAAGGIIAYFRAGWDQRRRRTVVGIVRHRAIGQVPDDEILKKAERKTARRAAQRKSRVGKVLLRR